MEEHEYDSVEQLKGSISRENCPDPSAFQRGNYMKTLTAYVGKEIWEGVRGQGSGVRGCESL